jgi:hypothetical protein
LVGPPELGPHQQERGKAERGRDAEQDARRSR